MRITIIGTGYVGLVTGACLADFGHRVTCLDVVAEKIDLLRRGRTPIYEPDLEPLVAAGMAGGRLQFTMDAAVVGSSDVVFLTVGTPQDAHGAADLTALLSAVSHVALPFGRDGGCNQEHGSRGDQRAGRAAIGRHWRRFPPRGEQPGIPPRGLGGA